MKTILIVFYLSFIFVQNLFPQEIFLVDTLKASIQLNSKQTNLLNNIKKRLSSSKVVLIKSKEINKLKLLKEIGVEIFDKSTINFKNKSIENVDNNTVIWIGEKDENQIILVFTGDDINGSITINNEKFKIEPLGNGVDVLIKFDEKKLPPENCENLKTNFSDTLKSSEGKLELKSNINKVNRILTTTSISVLVAYTQSAANACGNIEGLIQLAVAEANQSYSNSDISINLNLVNTCQVNYTESDSMDLDLERFKNSADGYMDNIHSLRNQYSADICVLITNDDTYCGEAPLIHASESTAFCVVYYDCATGYYSFAHEIGHLQGADHDLAAQGNSYVQYGHGYCSPSPTAKWRTIMAYDWYGDCQDCTRIQYWSNPYKTYGGLPMGTVNYENNARVLNETANEVANFRVPATTSGTLSSNESWYWNTLTDNVYVPSGVTLTINSGATVNLVNGSNRYSIISTGGTIVNNSSAINGLRAKLEANTVLRGLCSTIQTAATNAQEDNEIILEDGNFNENVTISNKDLLAVRGGTSYTYTQFGTLTINNGYGFEGSGFGAKSIYLNYDDTSILSNLYACGTNQTGTGLTLYNSGSVDLNYFLADYLSVGIDSYTSDADIDVASIYDNSTGLAAWNASDIVIDYSFFCSTGLDLFAYNFSSITATSCSYDGGTPSISSSGGSTVQSYWNQNCDSPSLVDPVKGIKYNKVTGEDPAESGFKEINSSYFALNKKLNNALRAKTVFDKESFCTDYDKVVKDFRTFIANNLDSPLAKIALWNSSRCYRRIGDLRGKKDFGDMKNFILEVKGNGKYQALEPQAERLMVDYYKLIGDFTGAVTTADSLLGKYKGDEDYTCDVMYAKGLILAHDLDQPDKAAESFSKIVQQYPKNGLSRLAENELRIIGKEVDKQIAGGNNISADKVELTNYPNPFNPTTTISYMLPAAGTVQLKIYDILGREAATLVNEQKSAGRYSVDWNGGNYSSGIYFYSIRYHNQTLYKKMLMIK